MGCYRYGFNGQEKSDEIKGDGNSYTAMFWEYDPRIGRRWNVDPKSVENISVYATFNNNPIRMADPLGDTVGFADTKSREMVEKYGKEASNKNYNPAFGAIYKRLEESQDFFLYKYDEKAEAGSMRYDGVKINLTIGDPGKAFGTKNAVAGILFEETKHAEQFLDGKTIFAKIDNKWLTFGNLQNEVEAKLFVANNLSIKKTYWTVDGFEVPTQLAYLKNIAATDDERMNYLKFGAKDYPLKVSGTSDILKFTIPPSYPELTTDKITNLFNFKQRTRNDNIYAYPEK